MGKMLVRCVIGRLWNILEEYKMGNDVRKEKLIDKFFEDELVEPKKKDWLFLCVLAFFALCGLLFDDIVFTTHHGINFWNSGFLKFYAYNNENTPWGAAYLMPIYLVFAVWDFPIWLVEKITGSVIATGASPIPWLWAKLLPVIFLLLCAKVIYKICLELGTSKTNALQAVFLFFSSASVLVPSVVIAQYDCISLFFILLAVLYYLRDDEKKFLLFFSVAVSMKYFALIVFIPLILIREKNLIRIFCKLVITFAIAAFCILYSKIIDDPVPISLATSYKYFFLETGIGNARIFVMSYCVLCLTLYFSNFSKEQIKNSAIWICMVSFGILFLCGLLNIYHYHWTVLWIPFIAITVATSSRKNDLLLLSSFSHTFLLIYFIKRIYWYFNVGYITQLNILPQIYHNPNPIKGLYSVLSYFRFIDSGVNLLPSFIVVMTVYIAVISNPIKYPERIQYNNVIGLKKWLVVFRYVMMTGFLVALYAVYFLPNIKPD